MVDPMSVNPVQMLDADEPGSESYIIDDTALRSVAERRMWNKAPTPEPYVTSQVQHALETYDRPHVGEKILAADFGDPDLGMEDKPPYLRVHPRGISLASFPHRGELSITPHGTSIAGKVKFRNFCQDINIGGFFAMNPLLHTCIPSTILTPIPTLIFSIAMDPIMNAAASASPQSATGQALSAPDFQGEMLPNPRPEKTYIGLTNTGSRMRVKAQTVEHARAAFLDAARRLRKGTEMIRIEEEEV